MSRKFSTVFFVIFCFFVSVSAYATPSYRLVDLGLQESDQSEAVAVNDNGQVAGSYWMFGKKYYFLWEEDNGITLIDLPEFTNISVLNNAGQIAGNYKDAAGKDRGFIWDLQSGFSDIDTLGGSFTRVYGMNDLGQIVGESESSSLSFVDKLNEQHAFLWQDGSMTDLGAISGDLGVIGDRSKATSINNQGQIIGTSNYLIVHKRKFLRKNNHAVIWRNGVLEEIDNALDSDCNASATSINDLGIATFWHEKYGHFAVNIAEKNRILFSINNFSQPFKITNTNDIFVMHELLPGIPAFYLGFLKDSDSKEYCFDGDSYAYVYFQNSVESQIPWKQNSFVGHGFNNKRLIVGSAANIFGERHAVLLVPEESEITVEYYQDHNDDRTSIDESESSELFNESPNESGSILENEQKTLLGPMIADKQGGATDEFNASVKKALENGSDPNDDSRNRHRPLQLAISRGYERVALMLIEYGADVNYRDNSSLDSIHAAINQGQFKIAKALIDRGVYFNRTGTDSSYNYANWYKFMFSY